MIRAFHIPIRLRLALLTTPVDLISGLQEGNARKMCVISDGNDLSGKGFTQ
jgi:hypothetical protein